MSARLDRIRERALAANAVRPATITVRLPISGEEVELRKPNQHEYGLAFSKARDRHPDDEQIMTMFYLVRWCLADEHGGHFRDLTYEDTVAYINSFEAEDVAAIIGAVGDLVAGMGDGSDVDAPKGSSGETRTSSRSTTSASSSAGSRASSRRTSRTNKSR